MPRISSTSAIDAQSKWRTPPSHSARSTAGSGLHFTAYIVWPGNAATNSAADAARVAGRKQTSGSLGRNEATRSSTHGNFAARSREEDRRDEKTVIEETSRWRGRLWPTPQ